MQNYIVLNFPAIIFEPFFCSFTPFSLPWESHAEPKVDEVKLFLFFERSYRYSSCSTPFERHCFSNSFGVIPNCRAKILLKYDGEAMPTINPTSLIR